AALDYASLSAGQLKLEESEYSVSELLQTTIDQQSAKAQAKGLKLYSSLAGTVPETIFGDQARTRELLSHLLANAIKFTREGSVELAVSRDQRGPESDWLVAEIRDTGIGIATHQLEAIFESFRQLERGLARSYSGMGLGLALARRLTTLMHGEMRVESE